MTYPHKLWIRYEQVYECYHHRDETTIYKPVRHSLLYLWVRYLYNQIDLMDFKLICKEKVWIIVYNSYSYRTLIKN